MINLFYPIKTLKRMSLAFMKKQMLVFPFILVACSPAKKEKDVVIIEEEISLPVSYDEVGKLKLSGYGFFMEPMANLEPAGNVHPYNLNTPLFTDYALKKRFIFMPEGRQAKYREKEVLDFPVGTVLIKNFYYDDAQLGNGKGKIIETRLLIREEDGWQALPYVWNEEQTDAFLEITGKEEELDLHGTGKFTYSVPSMAQCKSCHELSGAIAPIGPTVRQLNKVVNGENQLTRLQQAGVLSGLPAQDVIPKVAVWNDMQSGTLDERARAYLDINCGHCHRPEGPGKNSGLDLTVFSPTEFTLGLYKSPVAAGAGSGGLQYDIVPGNPDQSILIYRMESLKPGVMMPELGRKLTHKEGIALVRKWVASLTPSDR